MIRRPPRSTHCISSAASDVYKRQEYSKSKLRSTINQIQLKYIQNLENTINEVSQNYINLRNKLEEINLDQHLDNVFSSSRNEFLTSFSPKDSINLQTSREIVDLAQFYNFTIESLDKEILPVTYDNSINLIQQKNQLLKKFSRVFEYVTSNAMQSNYASQQDVQRDVDRMQNKITTLQSELKAETLKSQQFQEAFNLERSSVAKLKILSEELESSLKKNLKEENEQWQQTLQQIQDQHYIEIKQLQKDFYGITEKLQSSLSQQIKKLQQYRTCLLYTSPSPRDQA
eukprot:TRINITY_DN16864_c0_g1_i1.p1 TRINITY_DN16864_c0_g1~~TRINITY_DN16864_c0_g1_i1.p1  ORF type:complete len:286 (+),score=67.19 TRINITY_DN16864_c0_g1_i1:102-959(+)